MNLLQTTVSFPSPTNTITHESKLLFLGSCFSVHIASKCLENQFQTLNNPIGILFNPHSICQFLERSLNKQYFNKQDLFQNQDIWNCYESHSKLSNINNEVVLQRLNQGIDKTFDFIQNSQYIFITLGTAWIHRIKENQNIVANCHKMPKHLFDKECLSTKQIYQELHKTILDIHKINPRVEFIFTVSPIRHQKEGFVNNQYSKSVLIVAIQELCQNINNVKYFPIYEFFMDELRDYRFYTSDMLHPNQMAIDMAFEKFKTSFINQKTIEICKELEKFKIATQHKIQHPESKSSKIFKAQLQKKRELLIEKYPFLKL